MPVCHRRSVGPIQIVWIIEMVARVVVVRTQVTARTVQLLSMVSERGIIIPWMKVLVAVATAAAVVALMMVEVMTGTGSGGQVVRWVPPLLSMLGVGG